MLIKPKLMLTCGMIAGILLGGCSGDDVPATDPTAVVSPEGTVTPNPQADPTVTPTASGPNISPLGGKPATEAEKEYYMLQKKAETLVLSRDYEKAIPLLEQALEQQPKDMENSFYLLLSHGSLEVVPSKGSAAYPYAQKVVELAPKSNEASRARAYLVGAEFELPADFKYGEKTFYSYGGFEYEPNTAYKLAAEAPLHTELGPRLNQEAKATLWEAEVAPDMASGTIGLPSGTELIILSESHYFYSLTSWRKPLPAQPKDFSDSIFEINAFYIEVVSEGDNKGKKGWIVNQVDRYIDKPGEDPFGVWIPDRLKLVREAEAKATR